MYRNIIDREEIIIRFLNHLPIVTEEHILSVKKIENAPVTTKESITEEVVLVFAKRQPAAIISESYVRADRPPTGSIQYHSKAAAGFMEPQPLQKFRILKSVNPAPNLMLAQEASHAISQMITSRPAISTIDQFRTIQKPAYQIIYKNRAQMLLLS